MPPVDPSKLPQNWNSGPPTEPYYTPQPQPFPGATMPAGTVPTGTRAATVDPYAGGRFDLSQQAAAREAIAAQAKAEKDAADKRTRDANAGVDTTASQDQAVGHMIMLSNSMATINDVLTKAPDSIKPTIKEFGAQWLTKDNPTLVGYLQPEQRQRAANAYRSAVESAIWLSTGAAAPADQVQRIYSTLAPTASDKPELLADKRRGLLAYIAQAKVRAGPANLKAQEALDSLAKQSGLIYGDMPEETDVQRTLSTDGDTAAREIPPEMQKELRSFLGQVSPGKLDINSFSTFYSALAKKHGLDGTWDPAQGEAFVKSFNSGQPTLDIPPAVEGKTPLEQIGAGTGPVGTGVKNFASAMTLGLPEALAGEEGRIASQLADEANPKSALAGEVVGSIAPALAAEQAIAKALGKLGIKPGTRAYRVGADVLANMTTAGVTEYGQTGDSDKARTAAQWGAGGSLVGRGVAKGVAEFKPKEFREGLAALGPQDIIDDAGKKAGTIPATDLTTLQRMGSTGGEEFIEGFPTVAGTRQASVADFNRHNASRALAKAGLALPKDIQPGQATNAYMHKTLGDEYDKLAPSIKGKVDVDFTNQVAAIRAKTMTAPRRGAKVDPVKAEAWQQIDDAFANFTQGGKFDYDSYKKFSTQLREWQDFWAKSTVGPNEAPSPVLNDMARTADKVRMAARELVSRVNPTAGARLKRLDSAWAHKLRIEEASKGASAQEKGVYAPQELLSATQRLDTSKAKGRFARGEAFDQPYAQSAMEVVGHKPAKGGSVLGTAAIGFGSGGTIVPVALAAYAPGIKRLTQLLTDGRLGKRLDRLTPNTVVAKYPELKELPSDVLKQVIASYIREKPTSGE